MTALVTGGAGFVAPYIAGELRSAGWNVVLTDAVAGLGIRIANLTDVTSLRELVSDAKPDVVIHLGAISFVPDAAKSPLLLEDINVGGTQNIIEAVENEAPGARFLFVSSAQVMGEPLSMYAKSKLAAERYVLDAAARGLDAIIARPANHTGPGQSAQFVVPSFIKQAKEIKAGVRGRFTVGNLESTRDFTDVRDIARAYRMLIENGARGGVYLIGSNARLTMRELLIKISEAVDVSADYEVAESLWRPTDESPVLDIGPISSLGWQACIPLEQTIHDMVAKL